MNAQNQRELNITDTPEAKFESGLNKAIKKYVNKYNSIALVEDDITASILNKVFPTLKHTSIAQFNTEQKLENKDFRGLPQLNAINKHTVAHHIRKEPENLTVNSLVGLKTTFINNQVDAVDDLAKPINKNQIEQAQKERQRLLIESYKEFRRNRDRKEKQQEEYEEEDDYDIPPDEKNGDDYKIIKQRDEDEINQIIPLPEEEYREMLAMEIQVPTRPIIDINSTRLIQSRMADMVLTPIVDSADADRVRQVKDIILEQRRQITEWEYYEKYEKEDIDELIPRFKSHTLQEFFDKDFDKWVPRYKNKKEDALILATDVLYYIEDDDIYAVADKLNEGTFMVGAVHIPKHFDTELHLITYSTDETTKVEGKMQLIPKKVDFTKQYIDMRDVQMIMEMDGNDHTYKHDVRFPELRDKNMTIIAPKKKRDYIIKVVVEHRIDMGATYHTTLKFIKIENPSVNDLVCLKELTEQGTLDVYQSELTKCKGDYSVFKPKDYKIENDEYKKYIPKQVNTNQTIYVENPEYKKQKETPTTFKLLHTGRDYYIVSRKDGRFFIYDQLMRKSLKTIVDECDIKTVKETLINKINTKISLAQTIDGQFIKSLVAFINRENDSLPISVITSIIAQCLYKSVDVETQIKLLKDANVTSMVNDLKADYVKTVPTRFWEALFSGNIVQYLKIQLGDAIWSNGVNNNSEKVNPFH
jgi:hypothetical protein